MEISVEEIGKIRDFVLKQVLEENRCLVIGQEDLINRFCEDNYVRVDYVMTDSLNIDNEIESEPVKIYNPKSKEILLFSLTDKDHLVNAITQGRRTTGITESTNEEKTLLKHLLGVGLVKKIYRDGYQFNADVMCATSKKEKIKMINSMFRRPSEKTMDEMRTFTEDRSITELNKRFDKAVKNAPHIPHGDPHEKFCEYLGIDKNRLVELQKIMVELSGKSTNAGKLAEAKEIDDMDHEVFLNLLEKEKGISNREKLFLSFSQGIIMEKYSMELDEKFLRLEQDNDERIKSIGKRYSTEIRKSDTIIKIDHLGKLSFGEKMKACLWSGIYNARFYGDEKEK